MNRKGIAFIPILIIVFATVAFGVVAYFSFSQPKGKTSTNIVNTNSGASSQVPAPGFENVNEMVVVNTNEAVETDVTKDWQAYTSTKYGFSLKHPNTWYPYEQTNSVLFLKTATLPNIGATEGYAYGTQFVVSKRDIGSIKTGVTTKEQFLKEVIGTKDVDGNTIVQEAVQRNGIDMVRVVTSAGGADGKVLSYNVFSDNSVYELNHYPFDATSEDSKAFETIVTTFSLTTVNPTADWKTYTNNQYGFTFKYPNNLTFSSDNNRWTAGSIDTQAYMAVAKVLDRIFDPENIYYSYSLNDTGGQLVRVTDATKISIGSQYGYRYTEGDAGCGGTAVQTSLRNNRTLLLCLPGPQAQGSLNYWKTDLSQQAVLLSTFTFAK